MGFNALGTAILGSSFGVGNLRSHRPGSQLCIPGVGQELGRQSELPRGVMDGWMDGVDGGGEKSLSSQVGSTCPAWQACNSSIGHGVNSFRISLASK